MTHTWWKEAVVYQIYPRSFKDSNGDGIGDIPGIISKADYLASLGVSVVWLSPVYQSPNADNGYDISDYCAIMDDFGTMADWEALLAALHERGIRLVMDLVINHSSDEHPWFIESRKSRDNPKSDYYIWRDGKGGCACDSEEPNGWCSIFSGSAWKYSASRDQYYLHLFAEKQPDLNWENPDLRRSLYDMMRFWLDKGIDGFRMDVINMVSKAPDFSTFMNGPRIHEYLQEMNREVLSKYDIMTVGECPGVDPEMASLYVGEDRGELNMLFQFEHMDIDSGKNGKWDIKPWKLTDLKRILGKWQRELDGKGWNSLYLNNHDQPRQVSRFGNDGAWRKESAKMLATMLHTMQGTPYIYQGEELGMTNVAFPRLEDYDDVEIKNYVREAKEKYGMTDAELLPKIHYRGRDNARTPMQWTAGSQGGFTDGKPWLPVNPNHVSINAEESLADPDSIFHYYRKLIALRKAEPILAYGGDFTEYCASSETVYAYERSYEGKRLLVLLNFTGAEQPIAGTEPALDAALAGDASGAAGKAGTGKTSEAAPWKLLIGNYPNGAASVAGEAAGTVGADAYPAGAPLRPYEARVCIRGN